MFEQSHSASVLYNIEPMGIETGLIESFSSYLIRVSYEHNITVGHLINKIVIPEMNKDYLERSTIYGGNSFYEGAKTINGFTDNATKLIRVMEELTSRGDLSNLTLYKLKDVFPIRNLLKESFSWCPDCIRNWMDNEQVIYYPLIWCILQDKNAENCNEKYRVLPPNIFTVFSTTHWLNGSSVPYKK